MGCRFLIALIAGLICGCASAPRPCRPSGAPATWRDIPQATSRSGVAHICPYAENLAYTSRHVIIERGGPRLWFVPLTWQQGDQAGSLFPLYADGRRDLAIGCTDEKFSRWFARAADPPQPGQKLYVPAHRWTLPGAPRERAEVIVAEVVGGMIRLEGEHLPASSGACVINEGGELVAVHDWSAGMKTLYAAAVWGGWGEIPPAWRDREAYGWTGADAGLSGGCAAGILGASK